MCVMSLKSVSGSLLERMCYAFDVRTDLSCGYMFVYSLKSAYDLLITGLEVKHPKKSIQDT